MKRTGKTKQELTNELQVLHAQLAELERSEVEHKRVEDALYESEERFRVIFERSTVGTSLTAPDGKLLKVNQVFADLLGYTVEEMQQLDFPQVTHPDDVAESRECIRRLLANERNSYRFEKRYIHKSGKLVWANVSTTLLRDKTGIPLYLITSIADITERKRAEEQLYFQSSLVNHASDAIIAMNADLVIRSWNAAAEVLYGWLAQEVIGHHLREFIREEYVAITEEDIDRQLAETGVWKGELFQFRRDGVKFPVQASVSVVKDRLGKPVGFVAINRDITRRKRIEEALHASEQRFRALIEHIADAIALVAADGTILYESPTVTQMSGYLPEELTGHNILEAVHPDDQPATIKLMGRVLRKTHTPFTGQVRLKRKDGTWSWVEFTATNLLDEPAVQAIILNYHDITERKRSEAELEILLGQVRDSRKQLQVLSRRLLEAQENERRSIARELHDEIGQTLTAVKINLQTAQRALQGALDLTDSINAVEHVLQQVRNISLNLHPSLLDDLGLAPALRWLLDRQGREAGIVTVFDTNLTETRLHPDIEVACFRVAQEVLTNILRHAQARRVQVKLRQHKGELQLDIRDDGVGFDVAAAQERAVHGESSGLLGMRERVNLAGGHLEIESAPGHGTKIRAHFPLAVPGKVIERRRETR